METEMDGVMAWMIFQATINPKQSMKMELYPLTHFYTIKVNSIIRFLYGGFDDRTPEDVYWMIVKLKISIMFCFASRRLSAKINQ